MYSAKNFPYKIIFSDLDLTLLHRDGSLPPFNAEMLNRALRRGIKVCLVSARHPDGITQFMKLFDRPLPYIAYNGAMVCTEEGEVLRNITIGCEAARTLWESTRGVTRCGCMMMYAQKNWYADSLENPFVQRELGYIGLTPEIADFEDIFRAGVNPSKFLFLSDADDSIIVEEKFRQAAAPLDLSVVRSAKWCVDVMPKGVNKAAGIRLMLDHLGLETADAIAFGDSPNDMEMLKTAGFGVAMANGDEKVKSCAGAVTLSCDEDGVGRFLEKLGL